MNVINVLKKAVLESGEAIQRIAKTGYLVSEKDNYSPLTDADLAANKILKNELLGYFSDHGWLSEETFDDLIRLEKKQIWIVDPLDGTKEFVNDIPEYVVSVALIEEHIPVLAVIFNPATKELFYAIKGQGAWLNDRRIHCDYSLTKKIEVLASRSEIGKGDWKQLEKRFNVKPTGSIAYKLALVAAGKSHATFSFEPRSEWDIAAGVLLMQEAGGIVHDIFGKPFIFNQKNVRVSGIIASSENCYEDLMEKIKPELIATQL